MAGGGNGLLLAEDEVGSDKFYSGGWAQSVRTNCCCARAVLAGQCLHLAAFKLALL